MHIKKKSLIIGITVGGIVANTLFGLYNLRITKRVEPLTKKQSAIILLMSALSTGVGFIHLSANKKMGAYKKD